MSNDTALAIILASLLAMSFLTGLMLGALRRDRDWRIYLADQRSADLDSHWETAIK
jgi:hypothetical protein